MNESGSINIVDRSESATPRIEAVVFDPHAQDWEQVGEGIAQVAMYFGSKDPERATEWLKELSSKAGSFFVLLKDNQGKIIGYTLSKPYYWNFTEMEVVHIAIAEEHRGKGLIAPLMQRTEEELRNRDHTSMRIWTQHDHISELVRRNYSDRILHEENERGRPNFTISL